MRFLILFLSQPCKLRLLDDLLLSLKVAFEKIKELCFAKDLFSKKTYDLCVDIALIDIEVLRVLELNLTGALACMSIVCALSSQLLRQIFRHLDILSLIGFTTEKNGEIVHQLPLLVAEHATLFTFLLTVVK